MNDPLRQSGQAFQRPGTVEVGHDGDGARRTQCRAPGRLARHGEHAKMLTHQRQQTHADVAAAHDQEARLVEPDIVFCDIVFCIHSRIV
jgi:hypothetical protein